MAEGRRVVTVVFTDVSGSTELGERLDPEALRRVLELFFSEMRAVLEAHGGTVEKFIGDAVVAVFGIPTVHEDDALRAVRAAAEMRERLSTLNVRLQREQGTALAVRTGVNTGEVVAGSSEEGQFYATGDAVNVAARLEQAAAPGEILLGETTYRLVRDAVTTEPVEPLALKGKAGAVEAHRLLEIVARAPAFARRFDAPFVGREAELAQLLACFERSANERTPVLVTALGDAGVGKTRLAAELVACVGDRATVGRGHCLSYGEGITFWPLQEIVRGLPQLPAGVPDPERARTGEEVFWAYRKVFEALARERQLVLVLEDLHWAEPTLLDLIDHVVEWTHDAPMLILCVARPDLLDERPGWPGDRIAVEPLAEGDAEALLGALAGDLELETRSRIAEAAEGNPLFLEQLLALAEEDSRNVQVTPTIQALLAARLGRLETEERALIERAAIVGRVFWLGALRALSPPDFEVSAILQRLVRKRFVRPESSSFSGEDAFRFEHILVRDAAYEGTAKQTRADLHERFAEWLQASGSRYDEIIGYHLEQAFGYRAELGPVDDAERALGDRASDFLESGGRRALDRGDPAAAENLFERARALASGDARRLTLSLPLAESLERAGRLERAWALFAETIEEAEAQGDDRNEWLARVGYVDIGGKLAPDEWTVDRARETAESALRVFEGLGDDLGLARAWVLAADAFGGEGRYEDAARRLRRALSHALRTEDREEEMAVRHKLLYYLYFGPAHVGAVLEEAEAFVARAEGSPYEMTGILVLAGLRAMQGANEESRHLYRRARTIGEEMGLRQALAFSPLFVEEVGLLGGDPDFAERELRIGYEELERMGEQGMRSTMAVLLADALHELGRDEEGERFVDIALDLAAADDMASQVRGRAVKSKFLAARGEYGAAAQTARDAAALSSGTDDLFTQSQAYMALAEVLRRAGQHEDALPALEAAAEISERKGNVVTAGRARAELAELRAAAKP